MKKTRTLYLYRGIPGSGKSTAAKELVKTDDNIIHVEADMFFVVGDKYEFKPNLLKQAHEWCFEAAQAALHRGHDVVVSNTFTRLWEMKSYISLAEEMGATLVVRRFDGGFQNTHGVPNEVVQKMKDRFEDYRSEEIV